MTIQRVLQQIYVFETVYRRRSTNNIRPIR